MPTHAPYKSAALSRDRYAHFARDAHRCQSLSKQSRTWSHIGSSPLTMSSFRWWAQLLKCPHVIMAHGIDFQSHPSRPLVRCIVRTHRTKCDHKARSARGQYGQWLPAWARTQDTHILHLICQHPCRNRPSPDRTAWMSANRTKTSQTKPTTGKGLDPAHVRDDLRAHLQRCQLSHLPYCAVGRIHSYTREGKLAVGKNALVADTAAGSRFNGVCVEQ